MPDSCEKNSCRGLETLTDRVNSIEKLNGQNHKDMREDIHKLELDYAKQEGQLSMIMSTLTETKSSVGVVLDKANAIASKMDKIGELEDNVKEMQDDFEDEISKVRSDVNAIKSKPGETWEMLKKDGLKWAFILILTIVAFTLGLEKFI